MKLDQFLKWRGIVETGGQGKHLIASGLVSVNGSVEFRRGRQLGAGDIVSFKGNQFTVSISELDGPST